MPGNFQLGHTGCITCCDVVVESHAEFGVSDQTPQQESTGDAFCEEARPGLQLGHKAGFDRMGQDQVFKPTNLEGMRHADM